MINHSHHNVISSYHDMSCADPIKRKDTEDCAPSRSHPLHHERFSVRYSPRRLYEYISVSSNFGSAADPLRLQLYCVRIEGGEMRGRTVCLRKHIDRSSNIPVVRVRVRVRVRVEDKVRREVRAGLVRLVMKNFDPGTVCITMPSIKQLVLARLTSTIQQCRKHTAAQLGCHCHACEPPP